MSVPSWTNGDAYPRVLSSSRTVNVTQRNCGASVQSSSSSSSCATPKPPAESSSFSSSQQPSSSRAPIPPAESSHPSSRGPTPPVESSSQSPLWLWIVTTCVTVSRTVKPIMPSGLRPVFAARSKNGSPNPRSCGLFTVPFVTAPSRFRWTLTMSALPSANDHTNARSSVPGSLAVTANSTGAPRPWSNTCRLSFGRSIDCVAVDGLSTLNVPENTTVPWPGCTRRQGSKLTQNGFDPDVRPACAVKATVALYAWFASTSILNSEHFVWSFGLPGDRVTVTLFVWTPSVNRFRVAVAQDFPVIRRHAF